LRLKKSKKATNINKFIIYKREVKEVENAKDKTKEIKAKAKRIKVKTKIIEINTKANTRAIIIIATTTINKKYLLRLYN